MSGSKVKIFYFDARGRAEVIRLTLALAGKEFDDVRFQGDDWQTKYKKAAPFGQAPYVEIDGKTYGQSVAVAAYFARENKLYGKTNLEALRVDEVIQLHGDLMSAMVKAFTEKDETKKAELNQKLKDEDIPKFLRFFEKLLKENGTGVFVGEELTLADIFVYDIMFQLNKVREYDAAAEFPELGKLKQKMETHPKLKPYLQNRKDTKM